MLLSRLSDNITLHNRMIYHHFKLSSFIILKGIVSHLLIKKFPPHWFLKMSPKIISSETCRRVYRVQKALRCQKKKENQEEEIVEQEENSKKHGAPHLQFYCITQSTKESLTAQKNI